MSRSFDASSSSNPEPDDLIPAKLAEGLAELYPAPRVPGSVDLKILNAARARLARPARVGVFRHGRRLRWAGAAAAAVAAVAAVVFIVNRPHGVGPGPVPHPALAADINGDGRVDILDAYLVARALADKSRSAPLPAAWDVNHDGVVDQKDVDWIADAAVRVGNGGVASAVDAKVPSTTDVFRLAEDLKSLGVGGRTVALKDSDGAEGRALPAMSFGTGRGDTGAPTKQDSNVLAKGAAVQ